MKTRKVGDDYTYDERFECSYDDCNDGVDQGDCDCNAVHDENEVGGYCSSCGGAVPD